VLPALCLLPGLVLAVVGGDLGPPFADQQLDRLHGVLGGRRVLLEGQCQDRNRDAHNQLTHRRRRCFGPCTGTGVLGAEPGYFFSALSSSSFFSFASKNFFACGLSPNFPFSALRFFSKTSASFISAPAFNPTM